MKQKEPPQKYRIGTISNTKLMAGQNRRRSILTIVDKRIKFYSQNTNLLPPKPKSSFRHLKQGIQEFHRKYVLVPADKAANNVVVVCRLHYVNTLKQELDGTRAYLETDTDEVYAVNANLNDLPV